LIRNGLNFSLVQKLIRKKLVEVGGSRVATSYKLCYGDVVNVQSDVKCVLSEKKAKLVASDIVVRVKNSIIFQDDNLIVINKNAGLAVQGGSGIKVCVDSVLPYLKFNSELSPRLVHRIDKDTSGILLIARNRSSCDVLTGFFKNRVIKKTYFALVKGVPGKKSATINMPIIKKYKGAMEKVYRDDSTGKEAITHYKVVKEYPDRGMSLLEVRPVTGRTHQIRVHLKEIGHPIIGDFKYGSKSSSFGDLPKRLYLHAFKIEIPDFFGTPLVIATDSDLRSGNYLAMFGVS
jgi:23S rRNA pseudouridine955/2504/2580 synthase